MLGLAIGDALGKRTEFLDLDEIRLLNPDWRRLPLPKKAQVTDDTQMTLALARALRDALAEGPLVPLRLELPLRAEFVDWWRSPDNDRAPGMTCLRSCFRLSTGRPWQAASDIGSKGCGANMRVAPLGLVRELTDRLHERRTALRDAWRADGDRGSADAASRTEDLRLSLRAYRDLLQHLLAA